MQRVRCAKAIKARHMQPPPLPPPMHACPLARCPLTQCTLRERLRVVCACRADGGAAGV